MRYCGLANNLRKRKTRLWRKSSTRWVQAWLKTNVALFKHVLDYEAKLEKFLNKTGGWIREQEERIWTKMFEITGDAGTPLCASLDIMLRLLDTLPSFPAKTFHTRAIHPSYAVLHLKLTPSRGWGFTAWIWHASCPSRTTRRPRMFWSKLLSKVQEVVLSPEWVHARWPPPPQNPHRSRKTLMHPQSPLPPQSVLHPSTAARSPLLHSARSLTPLPTRSRHLGTNPKVVIWAPRVCPDQALGPSVVAGPTKGPQPDLRPVRVWDRPAHDQHRLAVSKSFLERPAEAMVMKTPCTLLMREMCPKAACLF